MYSLKRRELLRLTGLATGGAVLAACAPAAVTPEATATPAPAEGEEAAPADTRPMEGNMYLEGFPLVQDTETLTFFAPHHVPVEDYYTNHFVTTYEDMTNVHIEWELVPPSGLAEKKNLVFASGDLPDCFFGAGISGNEATMYGGQGLLQPIEDLIEQYNPEVQKVFTETEGGRLGKKLLTAPDGHIYQYPNYTYCYHCHYPRKLWINMEWLENLGLQMPETTEQYYEVMKAFKTGDPNGNGASDEFPFVASTHGSSNPNWFLNSFVYDTNNHLYIEGDQVYLSADKGAWREGVSWLQQMFADGLMDPESFSQDWDIMRQKGQREDAAVIGSFSSLAYFFVTGNDTGDTDERSDKYEVVPPLEGPEGVQFAHHNPWVVSGGKYCITSQCEHPELAARWIDWFYTEEGLLLQKYGREGKEWYHPAPDSGEMGHGEGLGPMPARFNWMPGVTWTGVTKVQNITLVQQGPIYEKREFRGAWTMNPDAPLETRLVEATDRYVGLEPEAVYPPVMLTQEETDEMRHLETQLNDLINESFARFITGDLSIDRGWDSYVKGLQDMGLDRYLEIRQAAYDRFLAS